MMCPIEAPVQHNVDCDTCSLAVQSYRYSLYIRACTLAGVTVAIEDACDAGGKPYM